MISIKQLSLIPNNNVGPSLKVALLERNDQRGLLDSGIPLLERNGVVFQDWSYRFEVMCAELEPVQGVSLYINDDYVPCGFRLDNESNSVQLLFLNENNRVFLDCYGFVQIAIQLDYGNDSIQELVTPYIPVLFKRGDLNDSVRKMVEYVDSHQSFLLHYDKQKSREFADLKENGIKSLEAQIYLAKNITSLYERLYSYFKINSRSRIQKDAVVDRIEKLQTVSSKTLEFIVSHPEQLKTIKGTNGVKIGNRFYEPQKTMVLENHFSFDLYENRVVIGFLKKILESINNLYEQCKHLLEELPENEDYNENYVNSSYYICCLTRKRIQDNAVVLKQLSERLHNMWNMYCDALQVTPEGLATFPRPTPVFMTIPQYNQVFICIQEWFRFGVYDFSSEKYMLSLIKISSLYEVFLLVKMGMYFQDRGYSLNSKEKTIYPVNRKWKYKNTSICNTLRFSRNQSELTIYYQPVVFDYTRERNGIGLYKNNSISVNNNSDEGAHYYSPDFIMKFSINGKNRYLILDAKFSSLSTVKKFKIQELVFKYLFSISAIDKDDTLAGLCIIYGKCANGDRLETVHDKELPNDNISPIAELLPLIEGIDSEDHFSKFDELLKKFITTN